ncbi:hypothetical protein B0A55_03468 [Friedmanniomyces simplex]|uniref:Uncharacterized protein n=1 Tax=Friedmanniomyces simplex TaxID=329884 RepID=A0A4U0XPH2_9PEZI|nr:hypothetical protein B0A55_03468 [Friedmanniomyces simplex]
MPPPLELADSEDEEGDAVILLEPEVVRDVLPPTTTSTTIAEHTVTGVGTTHQSPDTSTGSTGRITKEILKAERALLAASGEQAAAAAEVEVGLGRSMGDSMGLVEGASGSAATAGSTATSAAIMGTGGQKRRRHTGAFEEDLKVTGSDPQEKARVNKRSKTLKTYAGRQKSFCSMKKGDESAFAEFKGDDRGAVGPSPPSSARFTEHSDAMDSNSSGVLPDGTIRADFANHEPNVMFGDSGSTAVDGSSEQQRMLALARSEGKKVSTSASKLGESEVEAQKSSSSFPWTASVQTPYAKTPGGVAEEGGLRVEAMAKGDDGVHAADGPSPLARDEHIKTAGQPLEQLTDAPLPQDIAVQPSEAVIETASPISKALTSVTRSSPRVEIILPTEHVPSPSKPAPETTTQRSTRARKRKIQDPSSEAINSDDRELRADLCAVGMEKERYVPRLSKRRATQVLEVPTDFLVMPEKAAKAKRAGSMGGMGVGSFDQTPKIAVSSAAAGEDEVKATEAAPSGSMKASTTPLKVTDAETHPEEPPVKTAVPEQSPESEVVASVKQDSKSAAAVEPGPGVKSPVKVPDDDEVFIKPMAKPKPKSKVRRSHTTIFEDHVAFGGSQRTPTLSQQQAKRKSALLDIGNGGVAVANQKKRRTILEDDEDDEGGLVVTASATQKKRGKIIEDDEDDEDQLASAPSADQEDVPQPAIEVGEAPKKRGRGRPPKNAPVKPQANDKVLDAPDPDLDKSVVGTDEAPKKPGRGRKSTGPTSHAAKPVDPGTTKRDDKIPETSREPTAKASAAVEPAKPATPAATQEPTPSPEKVAKVVKAVSIPIKSSPTSHSPLKTSSAVPLRVGLNKRQRIPPLLRSIRPVKR